MDKKARPTQMLPTRDPPQNKRPTQTESEVFKKFSKQMDREKKARVAILISYRNRLQNKAIKRDKEEHLKYSREESTKKT